MTWPLAPNLARAVSDPGDPYINTWILDWDWYATIHRPASLFDAPIFYPARDTLAFSENLYGIAAVLFPFRAAGVPPIAAHNLGMLFGFAFSGFAAFLLGRLITGNAWAALASGVFYAFVPFRFTHLAHVQYVWGAPLPLMLAALLWYGRKPTWFRAALFGAAFLFSGLCNVHWLLFGTIAIAVTLLIERPRFIPLCICTAAAAIALSIFLSPYLEAERLYGMQRSWAETLSFSARPSDWLVSNSYNRVYGSLHDPAVDPERWLFPGMLSLILAAVAWTAPPRKPAFIALAWITIGFVGSLGLHAFFHRFLFSHVPGFRAIRVPARWASIGYVGLAMLVAIGTARIAGRRTWVCLLVIAALLIELRSAPILWYLSPPDVPPAEQWLAQAKPHAFVELPMPGSEYGAMLHATAHHQPMVNGISGFAPPEYNRIAQLGATWSDALIPELQRIGVTHLLVHADAIGASGRQWLAAGLGSGRLGFLRRFDGGIFGDWLFTIGAGAQSDLQLETMLRGEPTYNAATFGLLDHPFPKQTVPSPLVASGWAFSPYGIRQVNLLVNNGAIRLRTELRDDPPLKKLFPWYDATVRPRFVAIFPHRPPGVRERTDIQPEIIDGRGKRTLLEDRWITWEP